MTPEEIRHVRESFALVVPIRDQAAELFYARLFETDPSTRELFAKTDLKSQGAKLMAAIAFVVHALDKPENMLDKVRALAVRHVWYGVKEPHYESVGAALLWTLETGLQDAFTPEVRGAWASAYGLLSSVMLEAAREAEKARAA